eukprot:2313657-Amphidinium_carterae.3
MHMLLQLWILPGATHGGRSPSRTSVVRTTKRGSVNKRLLQWQCMCPFHKDPNDKPGTQCKKTLGFHSEDERHEAAILLRRWCLAGRRCNSRREGSHAHLTVDILDAELEVPERELDALLQAATLEDAWILPIDDDADNETNGEAEEDEGADSSGTDSSSSSSTSSSSS